jgi:predicted AlkP superfamily phosphohydrolase/phosphomutase
MCWSLLAVLWVWCSLGFAQEKKVVVIGFDGADYRLVNQLLEEGALPNLQKLKDMGGYQSLEPTNPPQTPVSWSTFATGINPGRTGIFDFIKRRPGTYIPDLALRGETTKTVLYGDSNVVVMPIFAGVAVLLLFLLIGRLSKTGLIRYGLPFVLAFASAGGTWFVFANWVPTEIPDVYMVRKGKPIWKILEEQGRSSTVLRLPVTFPAEPLKGNMIAGLAVPDIRGTVGKPSIYSNDPEWDSGDNQFSVAITRLEGNPPYDTTIMGPPNKLFYDEEEAAQAKREGKVYPHKKDLDLAMKITTANDHLTLEIDGKSHRVNLGEWTDWIEFRYPFNPLITLKGVGRFYLDSMEDGKFKLYLTPIHLHPSSPLPLSYPPKLAQETWDREPYKTMGWALDTWCIGNDLMHEDHFLEDVDLTVTRYEKLLEHQLDNHEGDLFIKVFSFTDRVGHVLWRFMDEGHPIYEPDQGPKYQNVMRETYQRMDAIVGKVMDRIDFNTTALIICSDHGFASWRYQFNYNTWLVKNGFLVLKKNVLGQPMELDDLENSQSPLQFVDWSKSKAYSLGFGQIFINLEGREPEGSVAPEDYEQVWRDIAEGLRAYVDEGTGLKPISEVYHRDEIYHSYDPDVTPDLRANTAILFRASWDTTLGGMPEDIVTLNTQNWSGDHCSLDPKDVPGILFSSIPISKENPKMADMTPSILEILGIDTDIEMDGEMVFAK